MKTTEERYTEEAVKAYVAHVTRNGLEPQWDALSDASKAGWIKRTRARMRFRAFAKRNPNRSRRTVSQLEGIISRARRLSFIT